MEGKPTKRMETIEYERESLLIDKQYRLRLFRHGRKVRCEVERVGEALVLTKTVDLPKGGRVD
jgi:hypothetical protein